MNRRRTRIALAFGLAGCLTTGLAPSASATYHENLIREVHDGGGSAADYVMLQAYAAGQNFVSGRQVVTYDGGGTPLSHVVLSNVGNGSNQATILVGGSGLSGADATDAAFNVVNTGGAVCFAEGTSILVPPTALDCVAYDGAGGNTVTTPPAPPASPSGTPLALPGPDLNGQSIVRTIARGCATALDIADDTNNSAADFAIGAPIDRNNATTPSETLCPPGNPASPVNPAGNIRKRKCKKKQKRSAEVAKKKKCKKKKKR
jgi:hypothetical protein